MAAKKIVSSRNPPSRVTIAYGGGRAFEFSTQKRPYILVLAYRTQPQGHSHPLQLSR
jgi:hypothetical protein